MTHASASIVDVQGRQDLRRIAIDQVGIRGIRHPVRIHDRSGRLQNTVATFSMYVDLDAAKRGTHMSRFVEILNSGELELSVASLGELLTHVRATLEADAAYLEVRFPFFVSKQAPVSGASSLLDYDVTLRADLSGDRHTLETTVVVPVTSLCPCSKEISAYGAHNQRSHVTVTVRTAGELWIEDLIELIENEASCEIFGLVKRADEKYLTERAYDNPKFVEDLVRDVAARLRQEASVSAYVVEAENFESIHNHSAYARIDHDKTNETGSS